jgi:hypothetical protein
MSSSPLRGEEDTVLLELASLARWCTIPASALILSRHVVHQ